MRALTIAAIKAGLIPAEYRSQAEAWGIALPEVNDVELSREQVVLLLERAQDELDDVDIKEVVLDVAARYMTGSVPARLEIKHDGNRRSMTTAMAWVQPSKQAVIPWGDKTNGIADIVEYGGKVTLTAGTNKYEVQQASVSHINDAPMFLVLEVTHVPSA